MMIHGDFSYVGYSHPFKKVLLTVLNMMSCHGIAIVVDLLV